MLRIGYEQLPKDNIGTIDHLNLIPDDPADIQILQDIALKSRVEAPAIMAAKHIAMCSNDESPDLESPDVQRLVDLSVKSFGLWEDDPDRNIFELFTVLARQYMRSRVVLTRKRGTFIMISNAYEELTEELKRRKENVTNTVRKD